VPLWGIPVLFVYVMRRVECATCGVRVEAVPWAEGKHTLTTTYAWFLAGWAKRLSWREVARAFDTTWDHVFRAVAMAVQWGRAHVDLDGIEAIGVDEIQWQHGHRYLTLVYQVDATRKRLLWIGPERRVKTLLRFFRWFGKAHTQALRFVCSDMWKPYLKVVAKKAGHALHILDRFHIAMHMGEAIEAVRRAEVHDLRRQGRQPLLTKTRWLLLKRRDHRTPAERAACATSSATISRRCAPRSCARTLSPSGPTTPRRGPASSSTAGVPRSCAPASTPSRRSRGCCVGTGPCSSTGFAPAARFPQARLRA
jgi:transposase